MNIKVIPSVDILNGKVVRLFQGRYDKITQYSESPVEVVKNFIHHGFDFVHVVNLDGAKARHDQLTESAIQDILQLNCTVQIGGGIRSLETAKQYASLGAKIVLGTVSVKDYNLTETIIKEVGKENVTIALDCKKEPNRQFEVMVNGWEEGNGILLDDMLKRYERYDISLLCTDISVDGTLTAPNFTLYRWIKKKFPNFFLQASGGISSVEDIIKLKEDGVDGVIVGRAIHHGVISMKELAEI